MQTVKDLMTKDPAVCVPMTELQAVARMMVECDCGEIPVVETMETKKLVGVITDRDIVVRTLAADKNPLDCKASDVMSAPAIHGTEEMSLDECTELMAGHQIRRLPIVDAGLCVVGMLSQADIAEELSLAETGHVVQQISQPSQSTQGSMH